MNALRKWTKRQLVALDCVHFSSGNCAIPYGVEDRRCPLFAPTPKEVRDGRDCCMAPKYYYKEKK